MSKKDYIIIARAIRAIWENVDDYRAKEVIAMIVAELSGELKDDNIHFDPGKFYDATIGILA